MAERFKKAMEEKYKKEWGSNIGRLPGVTTTTPRNLPRVYLFSWDEVPGNDSTRLINFLKRNYNIDWTDTAKIEKCDDGRTIKISSVVKYVLLELNDEKTKVNLTIEDGRIDELIAKTESGKLNIYSRVITTIPGSLPRTITKK